jgi:threonine dehydratase
VELVEDLPNVDVVIIGVGGGGLISGVAAAIKSMRPSARVIGIEPEGAPTLTNSLQRGEASKLDHVQTIADGLAAPFFGKSNFAHVKAYVDDVVLINDADIIAAMRLIMERVKVIAEPAAAAPFAALLSGKVRMPQNANVVCVMGGGNIDLARMAQLLAN